MEDLLNMQKTVEINLADVERHREELENLWNGLDHSKNDYEQIRQAFANKARAYLQYIGVPVVELGSPGSIQISNKSTAIPVYALKKTTAEEMQTQLKRRDKADFIWARVPVKGRQEFVAELTKLRIEYAEAFALSLIIDTGKPYWQSIAEGVKATDFFRWASSDKVARAASSLSATNIHEEQITVIDAIADDESVVITDTHTTPLAGGATVIQSLNYTEALAANDLAVGPIAGDIVAIKPPSDGPAWTFLEFKLHTEAFTKWSVKNARSSWAQSLNTKHGIDIGDNEVINALQEGAFTIGIGHDAKYHLHSGVHRTVGSSDTGPILQGERINAGNHGFVINELSGINPHVAMPEAKNAKGGLAKYVSDGHSGVASNTGARCTAPNPMLVHAEIFDDIKKLAIEKFDKGTEAGNPFQKWADEGKTVKYTKNGALMKKVFFDETMAYLAEARELGFEIHGGERLLQEKHPNAYHMSEAIIIADNPTPEQTAFLRRPKPFGPVTALVKINNLEHGIEICKGLPCLSIGFYGNNDNFDKFTSAVAHGSAHQWEPPKDKSPDGIHAQAGGAGSGITGSIASIAQYRGKPRPDSCRTMRGSFAREYLREKANQGLFIEDSPAR